MEKANEVLKTLQKGFAYFFETETFHYLYARNFNQFFEIDREAFDVLTAIRNGTVQRSGASESFLSEWSALKLRKPQRNTRVVRLICREETGIPAFFDDLKNGEIEKLQKATRWEVFIELSDTGAQPSKAYITLILLHIRELWLKYQRKVNIIVRAPLPFFNEDTTAFLKKNKIIPVASLHQTETTERDISFLTKLGITDFEVEREDFDAQYLDAKFRQFVRYTKDLNTLNVRQVAEQLSKVFRNGGATFVPEAFVNAFRIFKYLTSDGMGLAEIVSDGHNTMTPATSPCHSCWARNICWSTSMYETFGSHPYEVSRHPEACKVIYHLIEILIHMISKVQQNTLNHALQKQEFDLKDDGKMIFINP